MINDDVRKMEEILNSISDIQESEKKNILFRFEQALETGRLKTYFPIIGRGSYKLCAEFDSTKHYVIKFCYSTDDALESVEFNNASYQALRWKIFLPEYCFELSSAYFPNYDDESEDEEEAPYIFAIIIQPRITTTCLQDHGRTRYFLSYPNFQSMDTASPIIDRATHRLLPYSKLWPSRINDQEWLQAVIDLYGVDFLNTLVSYIDDNGITDLHRDNIGYIIKDKVKIPVIIDYL